MTVSDGPHANVLCGNIPTANATVYVIDSVLAGTVSCRLPSGHRQMTEPDRVTDPTAGSPAPPRTGCRRCRRSPTSPTCSARSGRGDQHAFAELYDATSVAGLRSGGPGRPRPGAGRGGHPGGLPRGLAHGQPVRLRPGQPALLADDHRHRKAVDRVRSAEASTRRDTTYHQQNQHDRPRLHRRGGPGLHGGPPRPQGAGRA